MDPERWQSIRRIFQEASELAGEARERFLAGACGAGPGGTVLGEVGTTEGVRVKVKS